MRKLPYMLGHRAHLYTLLLTLLKPLAQVSYVPNAAFTKVSSLPPSGMRPTVALGNEGATTE